MKDFLVRRGAHCMVISLLVAVAGCGSDSPTDDGDDDGGSDPTAFVNVVDFAFTPPDVEVTPGETVRWTWTGSDTHNVTFALSAVAAPSATKTTGTFDVTMPTAAATYAYQCTIHPDDMNGTVTVQ